MPYNEDQAGEESGGYYYYEDPNFYSGINTGIFSAINSIWDLVDRGNGTNAQPQNTTVVQQQDNKNLYIGFGILGFLLLLVLIVLIMKKS